MQEDVEEGVFSFFIYTTSLYLYIYIYIYIYDFLLGCHFLLHSDRNAICFNNKILMVLEILVNKKKEGWDNYGI